MFKKILNKFLTISGILIVVGAIAFVDYGLDTQCPDVAVYVYCGKK